MIDIIDNESYKYDYGSEHDVMLPHKCTETK